MEPKKTGRARRYTDAEKQEIRDLLASGMSVKEVSRKTGMHGSNIRKLMPPKGEKQRIPAEPKSKPNGKGDSDFLFSLREQKKHFQEALRAVEALENLLLTGN